MEVKAYDADGTTGTNTLRYGKYDESGFILDPQPRDGVTPLFLHGSENDRDALIDTILGDTADVCVIDFPATSLTVVAGIEAESSLAKALHAQGVDVTCVTLATPYAESLANFNRSLDLFPGADHVFVLNEDQGEYPDDWPLYTGDDAENIPPATARMRLEAMGRHGAQIVLPKIARRPLVLAAKFMLPFGAATADPRIRRAHRLKISSWLERVAIAMAPADHLLGFAPSDKQRLIFVLSDKGGVGKSTFFALLWERLLTAAYGTTYGAQSRTLPSEAGANA